MIKKLAFSGALLAANVFAQAPACSRESLKAMASNYFKAVETHTMAALPTTSNVRITENAAEIKLGEGFFKNGRQGAVPAHDRRHGAL
ncbi:MAG: hypothetical protein WDO18_10735 [Acidobacteriota bacterium]